MELSKEKIPLRNMYQYKTITISGNIFNSEFNYQGHRSAMSNISNRDINYILDYMFKNGAYYRWCECTYYPINLGVKKEPIVFWQLLK